MRRVRTLRDPHHKRFFLASNAVARDPRLSWSAKGIMAFILSQPDGFLPTRKALLESGPLGAQALDKALKELRAAGYVSSERANNPETGKLEWTVTVAENPALAGYEEAEPSVLGTPAPTPKEAPDTATSEQHRIIMHLLGVSAGLSSKESILQARKLACDLASQGCSSEWFQELYNQWWEHDWRGQKGQNPTPSQLRDRAAAKLSGTWPFKAGISPSNSYNEKRKLALESVRSRAR